jgi:hypothetical protein
MVVLLERRGPVRAWRLAHSRLSTAAAIAALLAVGWIVDSLLDELPSGPLDTVSPFVIGIPLAVLTTVGYYAIYAVRTSRGEPDPVVT